MEAKLTLMKREDETLEYVVYYDWESGHEILGVYNEYEPAFEHFLVAQAALAKTYDVDLPPSVFETFNRAKCFYEIISTVFEEMFRNNSKITERDLLLLVVGAAPGYLALGYQLLKDCFLSMIWDEPVKSDDSIDFVPLSSVASYCVNQSDTYIGERNDETKFLTDFNIDIKNNGGNEIKFFLFSSFWYNPEDITNSSDMYFRNAWHHALDDVLEPHGKCRVYSWLGSPKDSAKYYRVVDAFMFGADKKGNIYFVPMPNRVLRYNSPLFASFSVPVKERLSAATKFMKLT